MNEPIAASIIRQVVAELAAEPRCSKTCLLRSI